LGLFGYFIFIIGVLLMAGFLFALIKKAIVSKGVKAKQAGALTIN